MQPHHRGGSRGRVQGVRTPPTPEMTHGFLIQLVFCQKKTMWFIGLEVEQETSAPLLKKILDPRLHQMCLVVEQSFIPYNFDCFFLELLNLH